MHMQLPEGPLARSDLAKLGALHSPLATPLVLVLSVFCLLLAHVCVSCIAACVRFYWHWAGLRGLQGMQSKLLDAFLIHQANNRLNS